MWPACQGWFSSTKSSGEYGYDGNDGQLTDQAPEAMQKRNSLPQFLNQVYQSFLGVVRNSLSPDWKVWNHSSIAVEHDFPSCTEESFLGVSPLRAYVPKGAPGTRGKGKWYSLKLTPGTPIYPLGDDHGWSLSGHWPFRQILGCKYEPCPAPKHQSVHKISSMKSLLKFIYIPEFPYLNLWKSSSHGVHWLNLVGQSKFCSAIVGCIQSSGRFRHGD